MLVFRSEVIVLGTIEHVHNAKTFEIYLRSLRRGCRVLPQYCRTVGGKRRNVRLDYFVMGRYQDFFL